MQKRHSMSINHFHETHCKHECVLLLRFLVNQRKTKEKKNTFFFLLFALHSTVNFSIAVEPNIQVNIWLILVWRFNPLQCSRFRITFVLENFCACTTQSTILGLRTVERHITRLLTILCQFPFCMYAFCWVYHIHTRSKQKRCMPWTARVRP